MSEKDRLSDRQTDRHTDRQTDRQADRQTDRQRAHLPLLVQKASKTTNFDIVNIVRNLV